MLENTTTERVRAHCHQQRLNCLQSYPNSAKTEGKQSWWCGQFFLQIEQKAGQCRTEASARPEPVLIQSNRQRGLPIQTASPRASELADKLFLFVFLSLSIFHCLSPLLPYSPLDFLLSTLYESGESLA